MTEFEFSWLRGTVPMMIRCPTIDAEREIVRGAKRRKESVTEIYIRIALPSFQLARARQQWRRTLDPSPQEFRPLRSCTISSPPLNNRISFR